eukprot:m.335920 g.335920  ORF g.335920 m.335920 type:complete len:350 (+) comp17708_c0_seq1:51-1100(+)
MARIALFPLVSLLSLTVSRVEALGGSSCNSFAIATKHYAQLETLTTPECVSQIHSLSKLGKHAYENRTVSGPTWCTGVCMVTLRTAINELYDTGCDLDISGFSEKGLCMPGKTENCTWITHVELEGFKNLIDEVLCDADTQGGYCVDDLNDVAHDLQAGINVKANCALLKSDFKPCVDGLYTFFNFINENINQLGNATDFIDTQLGFTLHTLTDPCNIDPQLLTTVPVSDSTAKTTSEEPKTTKTSVPTTKSTKPTTKHKNKKKSTTTVSPSSTDTVAIKASTESPSHDKSKKVFKPSAMEIGIAIGVMVVLAIILIGVWTIRRRRGVYQELGMDMESISKDKHYSYAS